MSKTIKNIEYTFLMFLLILGLFVSSIGVTFCRYQVTANENVSFKVRGAGEYYMSSETHEWTFDDINQTLNYNFLVSNTNNDKAPIATNYFSIRLNQLEDIDARLFIIDLAGKEEMYTSLYNEETKEYYFIDENNNEIRFELEGGVKSSQNFRLELSNVKDALLSEIIIVDATYDIEKKSEYTHAQYYPLTITSPYLSTKDNITVLVEDGVNLTLKANMASKAVFTYKANENVNVSFDKQTLELEPNIENNVIITVSSLSPNDEIVNVTCDIYDKLGHLKETLKTKLFIETSVIEDTELDEETEEEEQETIIPQIMMDYINTDVFNIYSPIYFDIQSNIDTEVALGKYDLPACLRYSLDEGNTWYVLPQENSIYLSLKENKKQKVMIDLKYIGNMEWEGESYTVPVYYEDEEISSLEFHKEKVNLILLSVVESHMGIINNNEISFTVNTTRFDINLEYLNNNNYEVIEQDTYFNWSVKDNTEYKITPLSDVEIPSGTYRIKLSQKYNDEIVKEVYQYFFVVNEQ